MSENLDDLTAALAGGRPPKELAALEDSQLQQLAASVGRLKRHQERELERAVEDALRHIPALLRKPVRKMLFS
jgi:hypothetical protein